MKLSRCVAVAVGTLTLITAGATVASAGEVTGNGGSTQGPAHAHSICAYSGLNDEPDAAPPEGGKVQSYGQIVRAGGKPFAPSPGEACRGSAR